MPDLGEPPVVNPEDVGVAPQAPDAEGIPDWLKGLRPEDFLPEAPAPAETVAVKEDEPPDWLRPAVPLAPAGEQVIDGTAVVAPVLETPVAPGAEPGAPAAPAEPVKLPETPEEAYARVGRPMTEAKDRRRAEREALPDSEKRFLAELPRIKTEVEKGANDTKNGRISDAAASNATEHSARLKAYLTATEDVSQIAETRAGKRGAMGPENQAKKGDEIAKLQADIVCREGMLRELNLEDRQRAYETRLEDGKRLTDFYDEISKRRTDADVNVAKLEADFQGAEKRLRKQVGNGNLTEKDLFDILDCKGKEVTAAKEAAAMLAKEQEDAESPKEEAQKLAIQAAKDVRDAEAQADFIRKAIMERDAAIAQATTEIAQSDQIRAETKARLTATRAKFEGLAGEYDRQLGLNRVARNMEELSSFVDRLAKVRIEPGGLIRQLALLDQRIDYLQQPGAMAELDPALESAVNSAVSIYEDTGMSNEDAQKAYLAKLLKDRTNLQLLRDISQDPYSLIGAEGVPQILRQALEETRAEEGHRARGEAEGVGFLRSETNDRAVQAAQDVQRAAMAGILEGFGLTLPATEAAREHWQTVGAELRAMYESGEVTADWTRIIDKLQAVRIVKAEVERVKEEARSAQQKHESELEEQRQQAVWDQTHARFEGKESGLREAEIEAAKASLAAEFAVEFGAGLPVGMEAPREGQSADEWKNEVRGQLMENARTGLTDLAAKLETAREEANADAQREAAERLATAMIQAGKVPEMREEVERIYNEALDVRPEGEDKKHDKGVADRMKEFADLLGGKMDVNKLVERLANTGVGPLRRERTDEEKEEIGEQVMGAEIRQMENIRAGGGLTKEKAEEYARKMEGLNAALEGAGILGAGASSLLDAGFQLAIQTMFGGK